ncbi:hypothetical protein [Ammoniphilus sp. 3BR4]|uniref:hypothetical protein n=1 Tax=Ammoniphilus sp. 3BR4 TaxID=3158265 RepID=UPI003465750E
MIHRKLCDPTKTKHYSPLRMQFHFVLSRFVCWDGLIPLTPKEIAVEMDCDLQSVYKFMKQGVRDEIIRVEGDRIYLNLYVPSDQYKMGYVKHYPFIESNEFKKTSVQTQRFVLYTLWYGVYNGRILSRPISTLYHSPREQKGVLNLYSKAPVLEVLEEAQSFLQIESFKLKGEEWFRVTGIRPELEREPLKNKGEEKWLEDRLIESYCHDILSYDTKINLMKIKDEYTTKLGSVGLELFTRAMDKLLLTFSIYEKEQKGEVCPFLRGILADLEVKILPTLQMRMAYVKKSISAIKNMGLQESSQWTRQFTKKMCEIRDIIETLLMRQYKRKEQQKQKEAEKAILRSFQPFNWLETTAGAAIP